MAVAGFRQSAGQLLEEAGGAASADGGDRIRVQEWKEPY